MTEAIFIPDGDLMIATDFARGPWTPDAQHGGPVGAILTRALALFEDGERMNIARITCELLRPVPIAALSIETRWSRPGKKVQLVEASMRAGDKEVARATGLRIRKADVSMPAEIDIEAPPPGPEDGAGSLPPWATTLDYQAFHRDGVEHRFVKGTFEQAGPASDWIRLRVPLVAGEETLPVCRAVAAADFGNGVSWVLSRNDGYQFINPDLTVYFNREPVGEWICLEARTTPGETGSGLAESRLWDTQGPIGRSLQSLLIDRI